VGNVWIADETVLKIGGENLWLWDIIDEKTRFLLATRLSRTRTTRDAQMLIDRAIKRAGKTPQMVLTDKLASYLDVSYGKGAEHRQGSPFSHKDSTSIIERFHGTFKDRTKVMRGLKNFETASDYTDGWLVNYNYLRPHEGLNDKTPAEVADIDYPYKNWADIIRKHKPTTKIVIEHQPRENVHLQRIQGREPRISPRAPRITPKPPRLSGGIFVSKEGAMSRHYFRGAKRIR
jgi:hypothetical protein